MLRAIRVARSVKATRDFKVRESLGVSSSTAADATYIGNGRGTWHLRQSPFAVANWVNSQLAHLTTFLSNGPPSWKTGKGCLFLRRLSDDLPTALDGVSVVSWCRSYVFDKYGCSTVDTAGSAGGFQLACVFSTFIMVRGTVGILTFIVCRDRFNLTALYGWLFCHLVQ